MKPFPDGKLPLARGLITELFTSREAAFNEKIAEYLTAPANTLFDIRSGSTGG